LVVVLSKTSHRTDEGLLNLAPMPGEQRLYVRLPDRPARGRLSRTRRKLSRRWSAPVRGQRPNRPQKTLGTRRRHGRLMSWCRPKGPFVARVHGRHPTPCVCSDDAALRSPRGPVLFSAISLSASRKVQGHARTSGQPLHCFVDVVHDPGPAKLRRIDSGADLLFDPLRHARPTRIWARGSKQKCAASLQRGRVRQQIV
jgi:hypothetical protein